MFVRFERRIAVPELAAERSLVTLRRPGLRVYTVATRGLTVDSRAAPSLTPVRPAPSRPAGQLTVTLDGEFVVRRGRGAICAPAGRAIGDAVDEYDERWEGRSFRALVFEWDHAYGRALSGAQDLVIPPGDRGRLTELADAIDATRPDVRLVQAAFARIAALGVPVRGVTANDRPAPRAAHELAAVVGRALAQLQLAPSIGDVADGCGVDERTLRRRLRDHAPWILPDVHTWKSVLRRTRLAMATCLPSARGFTTERMAAALGYRHPSALLHAMHAARLPCPGEIRARIAPT